MLTPVEMQGRELKAGRGYKKNETDDFLAEVFRDYETLYKENLEFKDKLSVLSEGLQYYKDLEKTLQKTLVVAEKAAEETIQVSQQKAEAMIEKATMTAQEIINNANRQRDAILQQTNNIQMQYEAYMIQCRQNALAQVELLDCQSAKLKPAFDPVSIVKANQELLEETPTSRADHISSKAENLTREQIPTKEEAPKTEASLAKEVSLRDKKTDQSSDENLDDDLFEFLSFTEQEK